MTYDLPPTTSTYGSSTYGQQSGNSGVREQARNLGSEAAEAGGNVAQTAKEQGREVAGEASRQARNLYGEARTQLAGQAGDQQRRAAGGLRSLADEMRSMAEQGGQSGPASELARQAADRVHGVAGWLEGREPSDLFAEMRNYARRNPGTFLVGAALLGVLAGRLTRNVAAVSSSDSNSFGGDRIYEPDQTMPITDPDRTVVLPPTQPTGYADSVPSTGYADPAPSTGYAEPGQSTGYAESGASTDYAEPGRPTGSGDRLPSADQTEPLPGLPSSGGRP